MVTMNYTIEFDCSDPISIETYAQRLIGKSFREIADEDDKFRATMVRETSFYESPSKR